MSVQKLEAVRKMESGKKVRIVCTGDSITEQNFHTHGHLNYVGQFGEKLINTFGRLSFVFNTGISGESTWGIVDRLKEDVLGLSPDLVILMIGINDSTFGLEKLSEFKSNLKYIIQSIHASGNEILLMTQNPISFDIKDNLDRRKCYPDFVKAIREISTSLHVPLCDIYACWENHIKDNPNKLHWPLMNDYLHPNEHGHAFIAGALFHYLGI